MPRPIGSLNESTLKAKEAFNLAFNKLGGVDELVTWAKKNPTDFYKIYGRLIPTDVNAQLSGAVKVNGTINFIKPAARD